MRHLIATALTVLAAASPASAQDAIRLAELLPALDGSEIGAVTLGPAPPPGSTRVVRRSEVLAALARAGRSADGLAIPRVTRVRRGARRLDPEEIGERAEAPARAALAPCSMQSLTVRSPATVGEGELTVEVESGRPPRSGVAPVVVVLEVGGRSTRIPAQARVSCPAPVVRPGARLRLLARFGSVVASAPGVARQPGRIGDVIRVTSLQNHAPLRARVIDAERAEVLP